MRSVLLRGRFLVAVLSLAAAVVLAPPVVAPAAAEPPVLPSPDPLPTVQVDGVVWDQEVVGNTVYAVGSFSTARPAGAAAGQDEVARANALAYDITTGELLDWAPSANGAINVVEASADGSLLYLGGSFTQLNGETTWRIGSVTADGAVRKPVGAAANTTVRDLEVSPDGNTLYIGGDFTQINSSKRQRVAAVDLRTQALTDFAPTVSDYGVRAVAVSQDGKSVAVGGSFTSVNGSKNPGEGLAILETDGTLRSNEINSVVSSMSGNRTGFMSLEADSQGLYAVSYSREGKFEGMFRADWETGRIALMADCHGDSYDVYPTAEVVYVSSHTHDCSNIGGFEDKTRGYRHAVAYVNEATGTVLRNRVASYWNYEGNPATTLLEDFLPGFQIGTVTGTNQATWTVEGNDQYVVYGGEFLAVNGVAQQGLVRFALPGANGNNANNDNNANDPNNGNNGNDPNANDPNANDPNANDPNANDPNNNGNENGAGDDNPDGGAEEPDEGAARPGGRGGRGDWGGRGGRR